MRSSSLRPVAEILEARIAPATVYFMQADALEVHGPGGVNAQDTTAEGEAAGDAHSDLAVLLKSGDTVVFDADNNDRFSAGDTLLAKITGGKAMVFFTNGAGPTAGGFDKNEITGAAVSNGFSGTFFTDINGSVVTALDANGNFTFDAGVLTLQESSIKSLTVKGQIHGNVLAGRDLAKIHTGGKLFNTAKDYSVSGFIATGTAAAGAPGTTFDNGMNSLTVKYTQPDGANGGNISDVKIPFGAKQVGAGDGASVTNGKAGNGGSVSGVVSLGAVDPFVISAGQGGNATVSGTGGRGGSITKCTIAEHPTAGSDISFVAGDGGFSADGKGGAGGGIAQFSVEFLEAAKTLTVQAGDGGAGGGQGKGGAGGALAKITAKTLDLNADLKLLAGNGAQSGQMGGKGGAGGSATRINLTTTNVTGNINVGAGSAGQGVNVQGVDGGKVQDVKVTILGTVTGGVSVNSGSGGTVFGTGNGGAGGAISKVTIANKGVINVLGIGSGSGGDVLEASAAVLANGNGGRGGAVSGIVINNEVEIQSYSQIFSGGGGDVSSIQPGNHGNGGGSGNVSGVVINDFLGGGATGLYSIYAGTGKSGVGDGARGGSVGAVKNITLNGPESRFQVGIGGIFSEAGSSGTGASSVGGSGGLIKNVHGTVGNLDIVGSRGGNSVEGRGGNGASVSKINVTTTGANHFIHLIAAGDGGNGSDHHAGTGGSVSGVRTTGDIGDFTKTFGLSANNAVQGGIAAGQGGNAPSFGGVNGSVIDIKAARIATIIAGRPMANAVSSLNGVSKLAKIKATVLGADTGIAGDHHETSPNGGTFDWNEGGSNNTYEPSTGDLTPDGDTVIDGLILVNAVVAPPLPVTPLKLVLID